MICGPAKFVSIAKREFKAFADADVTLQPNATVNERLYNGDGSSRKRKQVGGWKATGIQVQIDPERGDIEFLDDVHDSVIDVECSVTMADNNIYSGVGGTEGEITYSLNNGAASLELSGEGRLKKL